MFTIRQVLLSLLTLVTTTTSQDRNSCGREKPDNQPLIIDFAGNKNYGFGHQPVCFLHDPTKSCRGKPYRYIVQGRKPGLSTTAVPYLFQCIEQTIYDSEKVALSNTNTYVDPENLPQQKLHIYLVDLTGDSLLDVVTAHQPVAGSATCIIEAYKNTGNATHPIYFDKINTDVIFGNILRYKDTTLAFADLNLDGKVDVLVAAQEDTDFVDSNGVRFAESSRVQQSFRLYLNTGTASSPVFTESSHFNVSPDPTSSAQDVKRKAYRTTFDVDSPIPLLADLDGDGDVDLIVGTRSEPRPSLLYYENIMNDDSNDVDFILRDGIHNPFNAFPSLGFPNGYIHPALGDVDNDGDLDMLVVGPDTSKYLM